MKRLALVQLAAAFIFCGILSASAKDTIHVITHNKTTVVTNPAKGNNPYKAWGVFPNKKTEIKKITLYFTLSCPDNMRLADWDYLDKITIRRLGSVNGASKNFEIARMLTPYGGAFSKEWHFTWQVDVTDFSMLLRDSVEIEYNHSGYEPNNDRGWAVTIDFEIIKGKPAAEPISITKIYDGEFPYGDPKNSIENNLVPVPFTTEKDAYLTRLRISQTGHGGHDDDGCGEFCSKKRYVYFDGSLIDTKSMWMKCGSNPLYPQAGTWIYDRANWCPGFLSIPDTYDLKVKPGEQHIADINMEPYTHDKSSAVESICAYLIQYKKPAKKYDASVDDIVVPSSKDIYSRKNPAAYNPKIIIRNTGSENLKELTIKYGTESFEQHTYKWKGDIPFNGTNEITLPGIIDAKGGKNKFIVELCKSNGNNLSSPVTSTFTKAPLHEKDIIVYFQTNNEPKQNYYYFKNSSGEIVYKKYGHILKPNTVYRDTVKLSAGAFEFVMTDSAGDGLEFWYNTNGGRGRVFLLDMKGEIIKSFESDFGNEIYYAFYMDDKAVNKPDTSPAVGLFPTRTLGKTTLDYFYGMPKEITVQITSEEGKLVEEHKYLSIKEGIFNYDLSYRPPQRYYLKVIIDGEVKYTKRIRVVDKL